MKKTILELTVTWALLSSLLVGTQMVSLTDANPNFMKGHYCNITIQSPQNTIHYTETLFLNFTVKTHWNVPPLYFYFYSLDGQDLQSSVKIEDVQIAKEENITDDTSVPYIETTLRGQVELPWLTTGQHSIKVFAGYFINETIHHANIDPYSANANFIVNTGTASPSPAPSPESTLSSDPNFGSYTGLALLIVVAVFVGLLLVYSKKRKH